MPDVLTIEERLPLVLIECLREERPIELHGFGRLSVRRYKAYEGRNPVTGERAFVPAKALPYFEPAHELLDAVNGHVAVDEITFRAPELSARLARALGAPEPRVEAALATLTRDVATSLVAGTSIPWSRVGFFVAIPKEGRPGRDPETGAVITIDARTVVTMRASTWLTCALNDRPLPPTVPTERLRSIRETYEKGPLSISAMADALARLGARRATSTGVAARIEGATGRGLPEKLRALVDGFDLQGFTLAEFALIAERPFGDATTFAERDDSHGDAWCFCAEHAPAAAGNPWVFPSRPNADTIHEHVTTFDGLFSAWLLAEEIARASGDSILQEADARWIMCTMGRLAPRVGVTYRTLPY